MTKPGQLTSQRRGRVAADAKWRWNQPVADGPSIAPVNSAPVNPVDANTKSVCRNQSFGKKERIQ